MKTPMNPKCYDAKPNLTSLKGFLHHLRGIEKSLSLSHQILDFGVALGFQLVQMPNDVVEGVLHGLHAGSHLIEGGSDWLE